MSNERKRLFSYLLAFALLLSTVCTSGVIAQAAVLKNGDTTIEETTGNITFSTNQDGQTVYTLKGDVTNGLTLTLENDETIVLDGNGYQLQATSGNHKGLSVAGDGTLIIENLEIFGGNNSNVDDAACGMEVSGNVNVILRGNVTITGGSAESGTYRGDKGSNGQGGMNFVGNDLIIDSGSQVTISGSDGGTNGDALQYEGDSVESIYEGYDGGTGLSFKGNRLLVNANASLTLTGGSGSNGDYGIEVTNYDGIPPICNGQNGGNGGAGMLFHGQLCTIAADATVSATGGTAGRGGVAGQNTTTEGNTNYGNSGSDGSDGSKIEYRSGLVLERVASNFSGITTPCTVTLNYPAKVNTASSSYIIAENGTVDTSVLPYPEIANHDVEWFTNIEYSGAASTSLNITGDTDLYAKYKRVSSTVTFETNGGSSVEKQTVSMSSKAAEPTAPTKTGYTFAGWFTDEACTNAYDFNTPVISDITLYAKWKINTYTVSFNTNGGGSVASQTVDYNNKAAQPADPTKDGYTFAGWFTDEACTNAYDFNTPVTSDITLYAKWDKNADAGTGNNGNTNTDTGNNNNADNSTNSDSGNTATYAVSFNTNGGSTIAGQTIAEGGQVTVPNKPSKKNCGFGGWYLDKDCTISYDFTKPVTKDMTLYAKWYTANFNTSSAVMQKGKSTSAIKAVVLKGDSVKSYKSSNTKVATITKNGKITAKATGKTTITVTTKKGASAALTLKVQKAKVTTKKITVTNVENNALTLKKGKTFTLETSLTPLTSQDKVTYSSSNKKVATVSKSGKIKAVKKGTAKITVKSGKKKVTITVTVKK